ncbi:DUF6053 domain-containing protein [Lysobacter sp. CA199]|uniref:DUF6053 domain-containing protein n=1 Tax=Lysobacter sp. CA199 TaxID=3455608 RepID=UPI003F8D2BB7
MGANADSRISGERWADRGCARQGRCRAFVGGPSGPTLFDQARPKGVGPEGPPTRACRSVDPNRIGPAAVTNPSARARRRWAIR